MTMAQSGRSPPRRPSISVAIALAALLAIGPALVCAQAETEPSTSPSVAASEIGPTLTAAQLEQLVGRIALYPDELLAIVLPASSQLLQVIEAQRLLVRRETDPKLQPPTTWDPSVVALLNYPDVLGMMDADLTWTQQLGTAVIVQQPALLNAIQAFRRKVYDAGNLKSSDKQTVTAEKQTIVVQSADPKVVYVPSYNPTVVVAPVPVGAPPPYSYSPSYPYYTSPAATFFTGAVFGAAVGYAVGWGSSGIYSGNFYGGSYNNVNLNRNVNVSNVQNGITDAQRADFTNRVTQNRENAWRADAGSVTRNQATLRGNAGQATSATRESVSTGLANRSGTAGRAPQQGASSSRPTAAGRPGAAASGASRPGATASGASARNQVAPRSTAANRPTPGPGAGSRPDLAGASAGGGRLATGQAVVPREGAFSGFDRGAAAQRAGNRGAASLGGGQWNGAGRGFNEARGTAAARRVGGIRGR